MILRIPNSVLHFNKYHMQIIFFKNKDFIIRIYHIKEFQKTGF